MEIANNFHAILIVGGNKESREVEALNISKSKGDAENSILQITPDGKSIGIEQIRKLRESLVLKPTSKLAISIIIIGDAHTMTMDAQNSLLKTLEEPPKKTLLILTAPNKYLMIPTIVSRCVVLDISTRENTGNYAKDANPNNLDIPTIMAILALSLGQRLDLVESKSKIFADKEVVIATLDKWVRELREKLVSGEKNAFIGKEMITTLDLILKAKELLTNTNANTRLLIENTLLKLPEQSKQF